MAGERTPAPPQPPSRNGKLWALFGVTVCALLAVAGLVIVSAVDPAILGTRGTAVITHCAPQRGVQRCFGSFRSDDGDVSIGNTWIQGEDGAGPGQRFTMYYTSYNHTVATVGSAEDIVYAMATIGLLLVASVVEFWFLVVRPRRGRRTLAGPP